MKNMTPVKVILIFLVASQTWIVLTDLLLEKVATTPEMFTRLSMMKGGLYVLVAGLFLYWLILRYAAERNRTEEELWKSRNMFKQILNTMPQSIFWKDSSSVYMGCNDVFAKAVGLDRAEQIVGKTDFDLPWPTAEADAYRADDRAVITTNNPKLHIIEPLQQADGSRLWIDTSKVPLVDQKGDVFGVLGIYEDITERKWAEEMLRQSEEKYRTLFNSAGDAIFIHDLEGRILAVNATACEQYGYTKQEFLSLTAGVVDTPEQSVHIPQRVASLMERGTLQFESEHHRKDGSRIGVDVTARNILWDGQPVVMSICRDITERKQAEDAIQRNLKEKETLLREIHHRVKNNMAVISSLLSLQAARIKDEAVKGLFQESKQRIQSMALVHEKLYRTADLARIDFGDYINSIVKELVSSYRRTGRKIVTNISARNIVLDIDTAVPCGLIINELVTNALKHAFPRKGGVLDILFEKADNSYTLTVQDNGVGLPEGFDHEGTGTLGMRLVTALTKQLRGTLRFESDGGTKAVIAFEHRESSDAASIENHDR